MVGIDIVQIQRISALLLRWNEAFLKRFLNDDEILLAKSDTTTAGFFAAKEAAAKALGVGIGKECEFKDIIISKSSKGAPLITFSDKVKKEFNIKSASLSISHDGGFAIAAVIIECDRLV